MIVTIDRLGHLGHGVARGPDGPIYVPGLLPGEVAEGTLQGDQLADFRILTPSVDRVKAPCAHAKTCGGCMMQHASDAFVADWKLGIVKGALAGQGLSAEFRPILTSPPKSRRRATIAARRTKSGALLGFHARASEVIVDIADCHILRPAIQAALPLLRQLTVAGASRAGELSLCVTETPAGLDVAVTGGKPMDAALFQTLAGLADQGDLARLSWDGQSITRRPPALPMGRAQVVPPPGGFLQATPEGEAALVAAIRDMTRGAARVLDLFAGCGTFSLPLAEAADVHAVEGLAAPLQALDAAARRAAPGLHRITTEIRDLSRRPLLPDELAYDAIVIDPPRAGAEAQAHEIARSTVQKLAWVSCDPVTFARDARILADGGYDIARLFVVDQFRWSPHVETVAEIRRR